MRCDQCPTGCDHCGSYHYNKDELKEAIQTNKQFNDQGKKTELGDHLGHEPI